jgi:hypothetical protein
MRITLGLEGGKSADLGRLIPHRKLDWELVIMGSWSQSPYHNGRLSYWVAQVGRGRWLLRLESWTREDAGWDDYRNYKEVVALLEDAPDDLAPVDAAKALYGAILKSPYGKAIEEAYLPGLLDVDFTG